MHKHFAHLKTLAEIYDKELVDDYNTNQRLVYLNTDTYYKNPVFKVSIADHQSLDQPLDLGCYIMHNQNNSCWAGSLLFSLCHLAHTGKWLAVYTALPERAMSPFWQHCVHAVRLILANPTQAQNTVQQFMQNLADMKPAFNCTFSGLYSGKEYVALDRVWQYLGGTHSTADTYPIDTMHWCWSFTAEGMCKFCHNKSDAVSNIFTSWNLPATNDDEATWKQMVSLPSVLAAKRWCITSHIQYVVIPSKIEKALQRLKCQLCQARTGMEESGEFAQNSTCVVNHGMHLIATIQCR